MSADLNRRIELHRRYLEVDPSNRALRYSMGALLCRAGRLDDARAVFHQSFTGEGHVVALQAAVALMVGDGSALPLAGALREALMRHPGDAGLSLALGVVLDGLGDWLEAEAVLAGVGPGSPLRWPALAWLARVQHAQGALRAALDTVADWRDLAPGDVHLDGYAAVLHMDAGDLPRAARLARGVLARDPLDPHARLVVADASLRAQDLSLAGEHFDIVLRQEGASPRAWLGRGLVWLLQQQHAPAIEALRRARELQPRNAGVAVTLGWAYVLAQDPRHALEVFDQAVEADRNFGEAHGGGAAALALLGRFDAAQAAIRRARGLDASAFGADFAEAAMLAAGGQPQEAARLIGGSLRRGPMQGVLPMLERWRRQAFSAAPSGQDADSHAGGAVLH